MTILCGQRQLDLALPTAVTVADLLPQLLRLMSTDDAPAPAHPWALTSVDGRTLLGSETLTGAGVLTGDLLILGQAPGDSRPGSSIVMTRDRIEDVVTGRDRFWGATAAHGFAHWVALSTAAALLIPAIDLPVGLASVGLTATVAIVVALTAVLADRQSENACAAVSLAVACGWAATAGVGVVRAWSTTAVTFGPPLEPWEMVAAIGSALLVAACATAMYATALIHLIALLVCGATAIILAVAVHLGAGVVDTAGVAAMVAVLALGALPRLALATGGLTGIDRGRDAAELDDRISRADRVLVGCLVGISLVAASGAVPAALSAGGSFRLLAAGIGLLLLLRSRAYSQTSHVLVPRIGGVVVLASLWLGQYRQSAAVPSILIGLAVFGTAAVTFLLAALDGAPSPVGEARSGRLLDLAEQILVVGLIVLTAGVIVLFDWMAAVLA